MDMAGREFEILPNSEEHENGDVLHQEQLVSSNSTSSQYGDSCTAVDLTCANSKDIIGNAGKSNVSDSLEVIKQGRTPKAATSPGHEPSSYHETVTQGELEENEAKQSSRKEEGDHDAKVDLFHCRFCDYTCTLKCTLNVHMLKHDSSKQFTCSECSYATSRSSDLKKHFRIHTGEKPYKCELCDYKSTEQGALRKHMLTHNCDKPHCCTLCDYVSPRIGDLKRHMHIHSDEKPHACQHCDYRASQLQRLKKHMLIHTDLKPYHCTFCDYKCREPRNLKTHIQTHTGEKPYSCPLCQYKGRRLSSLKRHVISIHHQDESSASVFPRPLESSDNPDDYTVEEVS